MISFTLSRVARSVYAATSRTFDFDQEKYLIVPAAPTSTSVTSTSRTVIFIFCRDVTYPTRTQKSGNRMTVCLYQTNASRRKNDIANGKAMARLKQPKSSRRLGSE